MSNYYVGISVTGGYYTYIEADSAEAAEALAMKEWEETDFGPLHDVEADVACVIEEE